MKENKFLADSEEGIHQTHNSKADSSDLILADQIKGPPSFKNKNKTKTKQSSTFMYGQFRCKNCL